MAAIAPTASTSPAAARSSNDESALTSSFERVSKIVYLHRPPADAADSLRNPSGDVPSLILVGGWMDARAPHLAKYTAKLQVLYPGVAIVLVRSFAYHFFSLRGGGQRRFADEIQPAVPLIRSLLPPSADDDQGNNVQEAAAAAAAAPRLLVHVFSNGGSSMLRLLYGLYQKETATPMPAHVTVFDSSPGRFQYARSVAAFKLSFGGGGKRASSLLFRALAAVLAHLLCASFWIVHRLLLRSRDPLGATWLAHNDRAINATETRRAYIYSKEDALVASVDVEEHAAHARTRGYDVLLEEFVGTKHVAHVRGDEERYWRIVREVWESRLDQSRA